MKMKTNNIIMIIFFKLKIKNFRDKDKNTL